MCVCVCVCLGDMMQYAEGQSPLDCLEEAAIHYSSAIKLKPRDSKLHYLLGRTLEEHHYAEEMYGLKKKVTDDTVCTDPIHCTELQHNWDVITMIVFLYETLVQ